MQYSNVNVIRTLGYISTDPVAGCISNVSQLGIDTYLGEGINTVAAAVSIPYKHNKNKYLLSRASFFWRFNNALRTTNNEGKYYFIF